MTTKEEKLVAEGPVETIDLAGEDILAVRDQNGEGWVVLRRMCEALGVDADTQRKKLVDADWACTVLITVHDASGRNQDLFCLHADSVPMWLVTIRPAKVSESVRPTLLKFQKKAARVLADWAYKRPDPMAEKGFEHLRIAEQMIAGLKASMEMARDAKREAASARTDVIEVKTAVAEIRQQQQDARDDLKKLPPAPVAPKNKEMRARLNEAIRTFAAANGGGEVFRASWNKVYQELYYRYSIDVKRRAKRSGKTGPAIIEEEGLLPDAYAIALELGKGTL